MSSTDLRPLTPNEVAILDGLLAQQFPGVEELRLQVDRVQAKPGCECGCGTITLELTTADLPRSKADSPVPSEGEVLDEVGEVIGGLLLFVDEGRLASLEVFSHDEPLPLPTPDRVRWTMFERPPLLQPRTPWAWLRRWSRLASGHPIEQTR